MLFETFRDSYTQIAAKALEGQFIEADLEALTGKIVAELQRLHTADLHEELKTLRSRIPDLGRAMALASPPTNGELGAVQCARLQTFVAGAVVRLDELLDPQP